METSQPIESNTSMARLWRAGLLSLGTAGVLGATVLGWPWLVAAGLAPIILALAPCAAMCALGLCMHKAGRKDE